MKTTTTKQVSVLCYATVWSISGSQRSLLNKLHDSGERLQQNVNSEHNNKRKKEIKNHYDYYDDDDDDDDSSVNGLEIQIFNNNNNLSIAN